MLALSRAAGLASLLALPLLAGSLTSARAQTDMCKEFCNVAESFDKLPACLSVAGYLKGFGCLQPPKNVQEPCVTMKKQFAFACSPAPNPEQMAKAGKICSPKWLSACHGNPERNVAPPSYSTMKIEPETTKLDMCSAICNAVPPMSVTEACFSLAVYLAGKPPEGAGCGDPNSFKQEPCATLGKQLTFLCNEKKGFCSKAWNQACLAGGWPPAKVSIPGGGSTAPVTPAKTTQTCPPNMMPNANRTGCVPKLDMPGDATPGSVPGAGRAMPGGGAPPPPRR